MTEFDYGRRRLLAGLGGMTLTATTSTVAASAADHAPTSLRNATAIVRVIGVAGDGGGGDGTPPPPDGAVGTLRNPSSDPDAIVWMLQADYQNMTTTSTNWYAFRNVKNLCTRAAYGPPGVYRLNGNYDHSEAGLDHAANQLRDLAIARFNSWGTRIFSMNIEEYLSINVPNPLTDNTQWDINNNNDRQGANTDFFLRDGLRREVHRFHNEIAKRALSKLQAAGYGFIEIFDYNLPRKANTDVSLTPTSTVIQFEANNFGLTMATMSGHGPQAGQNWAQPAHQDAILAGNVSERNRLINQQTQMISSRMIAYAARGVQFRPVTWPWPIMYINGNRDYQHLPVPTGFMTQMLDSFYAAGCRRFFCFTWSDSRARMNATQLAQAHANLGEAATWITAKANAGKLVVIGNSFA